MPYKEGVCVQNNFVNGVHMIIYPFLYFLHIIFGSLMYDCLNLLELNPPTLINYICNCL